MTSRVTGFNRLAGCVSAGIFALGLATPTFPQGRTSTAPPAGAGPPPNTSLKRKEHARRASEARLRSAEMEVGAEAENEKHIQEAIAHMKQDFTRIQVLRNNIARNLVARKPLDYSLITEQTAEINKRAHGLNVYMLARAPENGEPNHPSDLKSEEMTAALVKLCKLIDSFTENPALKNAATVDANEIEKAKEHKTRADKDLLAIMKLSESIHKKSESLKAPK